MIKLVPYEEGYRIVIAKELKLKKSIAQDYIKNLDNIYKVTLRPKDSTIVFNNAFIERIEEDNTSIRKL